MLQLVDPTGEYLPESQATQLEDEVAAEEVRYLPAAQPVQAEVPLVSE